MSELLFWVGHCIWKLSVLNSAIQNIDSKQASLFHKIDTQLMNKVFL